ncbi:MAG: hypothetical protein AAF557_17470 [Pseudomonadota bacterium]
MSPFEIKMLILFGMPVAMMVIYIHLPEEDHWPTYNKYPPELFQNGFELEDPFKNPDLLNSRLEDFGRFDVRYGEADGLRPSIRQLFD